MSVCSTTSDDCLAALYPLPLPSNEVPRPMNDEELGRIEACARLQFFLTTAPTRWAHLAFANVSDLSSFRLPSGESVSCVLWNGLFHITGTDIVRSLAFRFAAFGRPVRSMKKWEEGVFSDLRNLKHGVDAILEEPKSPLLDFLFRYGCIRTQKKQKVFYWFSVPHDRLFLDALERDLKREKLGQEPTTAVAGEPARSFRYDPRKSLYEQFAGQNQSLGGQGNHSTSYDDSDVPLYNSNQATSRLQSSISEASPADGMVIGDKEDRTSGIEPLPRSHSLARSSVTVEPMSRSDPKQSRKSEHQVTTQRYRARTVEAPSSSGMKQPRARTEFLSTESDGAGDSEKMEKTFACPFRFCARPFRRLEHLKRHVRTHTRERPFACRHCSRSFSRRDNLLQHERIHVRIGDAPAPAAIGEVGETRPHANVFAGSLFEPLDHQAVVADGMAYSGHQRAYPATDVSLHDYRLTSSPPVRAPGPDLTHGQYYV